jgi:hypothetical protein
MIPGWLESRASAKELVLPAAEQESPASKSCKRTGTSILDDHKMRAIADMGTDGWAFMQGYASLDRSNVLDHFILTKNKKQEKDGYYLSFNLIMSWLQYLLIQTKITFCSFF